MLEQAYELLRVTPPFRRWCLPPGDDIVFRVTNSTNMGAFQKGPPPIIEISTRRTGSLDVLLLTMAHEMVHLHEDTNDHGRTDISHSARFKRFAAQVCRHHCYDWKFFL